jgi:hypothetical protein
MSGGCICPDLDLVRSSDSSIKGQGGLRRTLAVAVDFAGSITVVFAPMTWCSFPKVASTF